MTLIVQKMGDDLAIMVPSALAREARLEVGMFVEVTFEQESVIIRKYDPPRYSLSELLAQITPDNLHPEFDFGPPVGKERFWEE